MEYSSGSLERVFCARFFDGEPVYEGILQIARQEKIQSGVVYAVGGVRRGGVVVGPEDPNGPVVPIVRKFDDAREMVAIGTLFADDGQPALHMHGAIGRGDQTLAGCPRQGLDTYLVLEVFILEVAGLGAARKLDPASGLKLLAFDHPTRVNLT
jgi:predicted DNA-binding protein with PD1-like motif